MIRVLSPYEELFFSPKSTPQSLDYVLNIKGNLDTIKLNRACKSYVLDYHKCHVGVDTQTKNIIFKSVEDIAFHFYSIEEYQEKYFLKKPLSYQTCLYSFALIKLRKDHYKFICRFAHILFGAQSWKQFCYYIQCYYNDITLPHAKHYHSGLFAINDSHINFWQEKVSNFSSHSVFPKGNSIKKSFNFRGASYNKISSNIKKLKISPFIFISSINQRILYETQLPLATYYSVNVAPDSHFVGCWTNVVPLLIKPKDNFTMLLQDISKFRRETIDYQHVPIQYFNDYIFSQKIDSYNCLINHTPATLRSHVPIIFPLKINILKKPSSNTCSLWNLSYDITSSALKIMLYFNSHVISTQIQNKICYNISRYLVSPEQIEIKDIEHLVKAS